MNSKRSLPSWILTSWKKILGWGSAIAAFFGAVVVFIGCHAGWIEPRLGNSGDGRQGTGNTALDEIALSHKRLEKLQNICGATDEDSRRKLNADLYRTILQSSDDLKRCGNINDSDLRTLNRKSRAEFDLTTLDFGRRLLERAPSEFSGSLANLIASYGVSGAEFPGWDDWVKSVDRSAISPRDVIDARVTVMRIREVFDKTTSIFVAGRYKGLDSSAVDTKWRHVMFVLRNGIAEPEPIAANDNTMPVLPILSSHESRASFIVRTVLLNHMAENLNESESAWCKHEIERLGPFPQLSDSAKELMSKSLARERDALVAFYQAKTPPDETMVSQVKEDYGQLENYFRVLAGDAPLWKERSSTKEQSMRSKRDEGSPEYSGQFVPARGLPSSPRNSGKGSKLG